MRDKIPLNRENENAGRKARIYNLSVRLNHAMILGYPVEKDDHLYFKVKKGTLRKTKQGNYIIDLLVFENREPDEFGEECAVFVKSKASKGKVRVGYGNFLRKDGRIIEWDFVQKEGRRAVLGIKDKDIPPPSVPDGLPF